MTAMVGLDVSDRAIKAVEVVGDKTPVLRTVCWLPLSPGAVQRGVVQEADVVAKALKEVLIRCSPVPVEGRKVVVSIPEVQSFVRLLDLPAMQESEVDEAVRWAIRRHIPFDLDHVYIDWEPVPALNSSQQRRKVLVGAVPRRVVDPLLRLLDNSSLDVIAMELGSQAILRCLLPRGPSIHDSVQGVLVIDLGTTATNIIFYDQGAVSYSATLGVGGADITEKVALELHLSAQEAARREAVVREGGQEQDEKVARVLKAATMEQVRKVERVVADMTSQLTVEQRVRTIILSGGGANGANVIDLYSQAFADTPVQLGDPWTNFRRDKGRGGVNLSKSDSLYFVTPLGLALRPPDYE